MWLIFIWLIIGIIWFGRKWLIERKIEKNKSKGNPEEGTTVGQIALIEQILSDCFYEERNFLKEARGGK